MGQIQLSIADHLLHVDPEPSGQVGIGNILNPQVILVITVTGFICDLHLR